MRQWWNYAAGLRFPDRPRINGGGVSGQGDWLGSKIGLGDPGVFLGEPTTGGYAV
jgi:hypothetical protein